jgi:hypothetical protein
MSVYTVHEPPPRKGEASTAPDRFRFVRDGFYFWAFLLGPLWLLWNRLWLVTVLYLIAVTALEAGLWALNAPNTVQFIVWFLVALLVGFEAGSLRRWTLTRRGWKNLGIVVGDDIETAERRFFAAWASPMPQAPAAAPSAPPRTFRSEENRIIGLFPQPGAPR